jgi:hypothetical protein
MKIALVFSGFFRTFDFVKNTLKENILDPLDCDVFFSTPKTVFALPEHEVSEYHSFHSTSNRLVGPEIIDFFGPKLQLYELRDYDSQLYKNIIKNNNIPDKNFCNQWVWRILSQLHSTACSLNIFKKYIDDNNINYDLVILARGDVKYHSKFDTLALQMDKVNYPTHAWHEGNLNILGPNCWASPSLRRSFNDQVLVGSQENILTFGSLYDNVLSYVSSGIDFNHETLMGNHLLKNNKDWIGTNYITYELWRHEKY